MSTLQNKGFKITSNNLNVNPKVASLTSTRVSVLWDNLSGAYTSVKIAEVDISNGNILCMGSVGPSDRDVKTGQLLKYDSNKYIVSWTQNNGDKEAYVQAYSNCLPLNNYEKLSSSNYYDVSYLSLTRLQDNEFAVIWSTIRNLGNYNHYKIRGEIYELKSDNKIHDHKTLSLEEYEHDIQDQSVVASFPSGKFISVWREQKGNNEIRVRIFSSSGSPASFDWELSQGTDQYKSPDVKIIGKKAFVVWYKESGSNKGIYGRFVHEDNYYVGNAIYIQEVSGANIEPKLVIANGKYLVHWADASGKINVKIYDEFGNFDEKECKVLEGNLNSNDFSIDSLSSESIIYGWSKDSQIYVGTKKATKICDITKTESKSVTFGTESGTSTQTPSLSHTSSISDSVTGTATVTSTVTSSESKSLSATDSRTDSSSQSGSASESNTKTISDSSTISETASTTLSRYKPGTESESKSISVSESPSSSVSESKSSSISQTDTESKSATNSLSSTVSETASVSETNTRSRYKPGTESSSKSASFSESTSTTDSISSSDSLSNSYSASNSGTISKSASDSTSASKSQSESRSHSESYSNSPSSSITDSINPTPTYTITTKCGKDEIGKYKDKVVVDIRVDNIRLTEVDSTSSPSIYEQHTTQTYSNNGRSDTNERVRLTVKDNAKDYIDNIDLRFIDSNYIINGTVRYSNNVLNTDLVYNDPNIIQTEREQCNREDYTNYGLLQKNLRFYGINKCEYNVVSSQRNLELKPGECSIHSLTAKFNKNIKVSYQADIFVKAWNKFDGKAYGDELKVISECLLLPQLDWGFVNNEREVKSTISGTITHTALQSANHDKKECVNQLPYVHAKLSYRNFTLSLPNDLEPYLARYTDQSDHVNTNRYGDLNYESTLSINLPLTGTLKGFNNDIASVQYVLTGNVSYTSPPILDNLVASNIRLASYEFVNQKQTSYDLFDFSDTVSTNMFTSWDRINLKDSSSVKIEPNRCKEVVLEVFVYKDVPITYTAKGHLSLKDENGRTLFGQSLESSAANILSRSFVINREEAVFDISGVMTYTIVKNVTSYTRDCISRLQSSSQLPDVIVSLRYDNYQLTQPSNLEQYVAKYTDSVKRVNINRYEKTNAVANLSINIPITGTLEGYAYDISSTRQIISGTVNYQGMNVLDNFITEENKVSGYISSKHKQETHDILSLKSKISTEEFSSFRSINLQESLNVIVAPNKCIETVFEAFVYENVPISYNAKGHLRIKDANERVLDGPHLQASASDILNKEFTLEKEEAVFDISGSMTHTFIKNVTSYTRDCESNYLDSTKLPDVIVSLTYNNYEFDSSSLVEFSNTKKEYFSGHSIVNSKKYGISNVQSTVNLEVKLSKSLNSHYSDIKPNDIVKDGTVKFIRNFNEIQDLHNNDRSGYTLDTAGIIEQPWFSSQYEVSSSITSSWNTLKASSIYSEGLVPGQCVDIRLTAQIYENVRVKYTAKGYFTAKTLDGIPLQGDELLNVAQMVLSNNNITMNGNGEMVFETTGFLEHSFVAGVVSNSSDCNL